MRSLTPSSALARGASLVAAALLMATAGCARGVATSAASAASAASTPAAAPARAASARPLVIAHRGASGHVPEHTAAAYTLAIAQGADYVEPDLVLSKDSALVVRHENELGATTDVAARFPDRRRTKTIDGQSVTGWFSEDFTLAELRTLRAVERIPFRSKAEDGKHAILTFDELLDLVARESRARGRTIGLFPEIKHSSYFRGIGLPIEEPMVAALARRGWTTKDAPVVVQSFEVGNLKRLRAMTGVRLAQLIAPGGAPWDWQSAGERRDYASMTTPAGLREIATYADGINVEKRLIQPIDSAGALLAPTPLVRDAHAAGLAVYAWTLRNEPYFLPRGYGGDPAAEWTRLASLGVDGLFGDFPDVGARALRGAQPPEPTRTSGR